MEYRGNYEQANACQSYWQGNPYSDFYNGNPRNEPDFSWMRNDVRNPSYQPTYQHPYQSTYHPPYHPTYQEPYQPHFQPTYQEPYHPPCPYSDPHMPTFRQPLPYNPPQPNNDLAELKAMLQQSINIEQQTQATLKTQEEELNRLMLHQKNQETLFAQIANSISMWQPEDLPPQEQQSHEIVHTIMFRSSTDYNIPKMSEDDEFEVPSKGLEVEIVDGVESEDETEILVENTFTRPSITSVDRVKVPVPIDTNTRSSKSTTDRVNSPESPIAEILNVKATTKEIEEPTKGPSEKVNELVCTSKAIEVRNSELKPEASEVTTLKLELPPSDLNIYLINDNEDYFVINNTILSKPHPLEKGHYFYIQGQGKLQSTMPKVAKGEVHPERDGTRRGIKRCWDPGGFFDKVRIVPWARKRGFGSRFGGANGRGMQDDYDDPGDERVTMHSDSEVTVVRDHYKPALLGR